MNHRLLSGMVARIVQYSPRPTDRANRLMARTATYLKGVPKIASPLPSSKTEPNRYPFFRP